MEIVEALISNLGSRALITDPEILSGFTSDWTGRFTGEAIGAVRPTNSWQVQRIVEIARSHSTPIVTQGGNTGLVGGGVPVQGGLILLTQLLKGIELDPASQVASVGAGVTLSELNARAREVGLRFGVDLASRESATIGGMAATNAGGIHVLRYGSTRQQLLGIEAVLGTGHLISRMDALYKDNTGYDWASILCGSEGTLGIITRVALRLIPIQPHATVALISLESLEDAVRLTGGLRRQFYQLDAAEVMALNGLELVHQLEGRKWPLGDLPPYALLVELTGNEVLVEELAEFLEAHEGILDAALAYDSAAESLWYWREQHTVAISRHGVPHKLDVTLPMSDLANFVISLIELLSGEFPSVRLVLFGHLGDGNIHINLLNVGDKDGDVDHEILAMVASYGGSISSEHGIGQAKAGDLSLTRTPEDISSMKALKAALDPEGILNPGVLFT